MSTSNYTNTAYAITYSGGFFKITFAAPLSESFYFNRELLNIRVSPLGAVYVDLGQFDWGILTVNYQLATAPTPIFAVGPPIVYITRDQWIAALLALITTPNVAPTTLAASALTNSLVGYNATTDQWTDLGASQQHRFYVYMTVNQAVNIAGTTILYNTISEDPMSGYNAATGIYTVPYAGTWIFGIQTQTVANSASALCLNGTNTSLAKAYSNNNIFGNSSVAFYCNVGDTLRVVNYGATTILASLGELLHFWGKRIV